MPDASPSKWHLAHTAWFFETFVPERFERDFRAFDPAFRVLFNSYCQGMAPQHPRAQRGLLSRPALDEVRAWRQQVDERVLALVGSPAAEDAACRSLLQLGLQHAQQHQELLLTDILHALSCNPVLPAYTPAPSTASPAATPLRWLRVGGGIVPLGHEAGLDGEFHFDNEGPRHEVALRDFELASRPVSCGDFQAFIDDGGYRRHELWLSPGWDWVRAVVLAGRWPQPVHAARPHAAGGWRDTGAAELLRGRCLCALGLRPAANRGRLGACGAPVRAAAGQRRAAWCGRAAADVRHGLAVDTVVLRPPTPVIARRPAQWANTTASSCATSS